MQNTFNNLNKNNLIDFDNLDESLYVPFFTPVFKKITNNETGIEIKTGGIPFFIESEEWPVDRLGNRLTFIGQFNDPRTDDNILYRVFHGVDDIYCNFDSNVSKIYLSDENLSKKIIIENDDTNDTTIQYPPYEIISWEQSKELSPIEYIYDYYQNKYNILFDKYTKEILRTKYYDSQYSPSYGIKIGGTSVFCQYNDYYYDPSKFRNFIQISECTELPYSWGDSGIAHIFENNENKSLWLQYDC
jgi:uncharacterized protein YwqG